MLQESNPELIPKSQFRLGRLFLFELIFIFFLSAVIIFFLNFFNVIKFPINLTSNPLSILPSNASIVVRSTIEYILEDKINKIEHDGKFWKLTLNYHLTHPSLPPFIIADNANIVETKSDFSSGIKKITVNELKPGDRVRINVYYFYSSPEKSWIILLIRKSNS